jgi:hypothetical protein
MVHVGSTCHCKLRQPRSNTQLVIVMNIHTVCSNGYDSMACRSWTVWSLSPSAAGSNPNDVINVSLRVSIMAYLFNALQNKFNNTSFVESYIQLDTLNYVEHFKVTLFVLWRNSYYLR